MNSHPRNDQPPADQPSADQRVTAYALGELDPAQTAEFEQQMLSDPSVAAAVAQTRAITGQLKRLFAEEPPRALDADRRQSILGLGQLAEPHVPASLAQAPASPSGPSPSVSRAGRGSAVALRWFALAASLLLLVGAAGYQWLGRNDASGDSGRRLPRMLAQRLTSDEPAAPRPAAEQRRAAGQANATPAQPLGLSQQSDGAVADDLQRKSTAARLELATPAQPAEPAAAGQSDETKRDVAGVVRLLAERPVRVPERLAERSLRVGDEVRLESENRPGYTQMSISTSGGMGGASVGTGDQLEAIRNSQAAVRQDWYFSTPQEGMLSMDDQGRGPGAAGDRFDVINENPFQRVSEHPLSTFSVDVDTASYAKVRQYLQAGRLPRPDVVRIEELVNYFDYNDVGPPAEGPHPLAASIEIAQCPWKPEHRLARVAVQAKQIDPADRPPCNLVFLIDTSGSMNVPNRLPLVQRGLQSLLDQLRSSDRVAVVAYAGSAGLVLSSTPASEVSKIRQALTRLQAGGSTNGGDGIELAYQTARDHFIAAGVNRVILCTDGDFNVGTTSPDALIRLVQQQADGGIDLTVLGFGMGNHNDAMLEQISGRGNGNYAFIDSPEEARRVLVQRATSTLFTIARDVKIQVEFNPGQVAAYRLIGYENRLLAKQDFNDDTKDAGEVGAGHSVTALYELIPHGGDTQGLPAAVDDLKYQRPPAAARAADRDEMMTVKLRYQPVEKADDAIGDGGDAPSILLEFAARDSGQRFSQASGDFRLAALVAAFGLQLRRSEHRGEWTLSDVLREATAIGGEPNESRDQWIELVRRAAELESGESGR